MNSNPRIVLNCDMGESYGQFKVGHDEDLMPLIDACNIACGFHAGDPWHMEKTIDLALKHNVQIGAHPGYPDIQGFGRRAMKLPYHELSAIIKYQVAAIKGMVESKGGILQHVKPHGALYNAMSKDLAMAKIVIEAIQAIDSTLPLMGLAGSPLQQYAESHQVPFIAEAFADRKYESSGELRARTLSDAVILDPQKAAQQVVKIAYEGKVISYSGQRLPLTAQSFCVHGDHPSAQSILNEIKEVIANPNRLKKYLSHEN